MKRTYGLLAFGLIMVLTAGASTAHAAKGVKKKGDHKIHGTVVAVHHEKAGHGSITVKIHHHHKKTATQTSLKTPTAVKAVKPATAVKTPSAATPGHHHGHHTFTVSNATKFISVGGQGQGSASFSSVHKGEHVVILAKGHHADEVEILHHHQHQVAPKSTKVNKVRKKT